jgi:hypothetical protein
VRASTVGVSSVCWSMSMFDDEDDVEGGAVAMLMLL